MERKYKAVIFDMDGTILNTLDDLTSAVNVTMDRFGYPRRTTEQVRRAVGNGVRKLIERVLPGGEHDPHFSEAYEFYVEYYTAHALIKTAPYDGIPELFRELRRNGIRCAVVSNKMHEAVVELTRIFFPDADYSCGEREDEGIRKKPWPDMVFDCLKALGVSNAEAVYVGDSDVDIETAENAGLECISVLWGFRDRDELLRKGAATMVSSPEELKAVLLGADK